MTLEILDTFKLHDLFTHQLVDIVLDPELRQGFILAPALGGVVSNMLTEFPRPRGAADNGLPEASKPLVDLVQVAKGLGSTIPGKEVSRICAWLE